MDKWLRNPKVVMVISLILGILLWSVVHLDERKDNPVPLVTSTNTTQEFENISLTISGLDESRYHLVGIDPRNVRIRVRGSSTAIKNINTDTSRVLLDLSTVKPGDQAIKLTQSGFPSGLSVEIIPSSVIVTIEEMLKKEMPVEVVLKGGPQDGFTAGTPIIQPNRVFANVPEHQIDAIHAIRGEIDITGASTTVSKQVKLSAYDKNGAKVDAIIEPSVVTIEVPITEPSKLLTLQVQLRGTPAEGYSIVKVEQTPLEVIAYGKQELLDQLEFYDGLTIDVSGLNADKTFTLDIPVRTDISKTEPNKVDVKITVAASQQKTLPQLKVIITGLNEQHEASFVDPAEGRLDVTVVGAPEVVDSVQAEDIDAIIDITNLPVGQHVVPIVYSFPSFVKIAPGVKSTATVEIKSIEVNTDTEGET